MIEGYTTRLRLAQPDDAAFIHGLRTNPALNRYLSPVTGGVEAQRHWLEQYKARESMRREFYYVIESLKTGQPCGTVRLYDINERSFTWGSWILDTSKPRKAALETAVLSFGIGFDWLGKESAQVEVREENGIALSFYKRFGMRELRRAEGIIHFECRPEHCEKASASLRSLHAAFEE